MDYTLEIIFLIIISVMVDLAPKGLILNDFFDNASIYRLLWGFRL